MADMAYFSVVEATHEIQNPYSPEKLRRVAEYLAPRPGERVLDIGAGRGWWAVELASRHGVSVTACEINEDFADAARLRARDAGVADLVEVVVGPAAEFPGRGFDVVTCIGASFALDGYEPALDWMVAAARPAGRLAIGEVHVVDGEPRELFGMSLTDLAGLVAALDARGVEPTGIVASSVHDWDHYESQHWRGVDAWARAHPDDPRRAEFVELSRGFRDQYLRELRGRMGWSVLTGRHR